MFLHVCFIQIYSVQQLRHRLQTSGLYIANTKPGGFSLEVANNDSNQVIVGLRIHLGTQDIIRVPSTIEILGRSVAIKMSGYVPQNMLHQ